VLIILQNFGDVTFEKVVTGQFPTRLVVGLVSNTAFNGSRRHNPFNFQHYNLLEIAVYLDGQQQHVLKQIQPNYEGNQVQLAVLGYEQTEPRRRQQHIA